MKYGLIGKTLVHSYSKEIHEALGKYSYELFSLAPEEVSGFVKAHDFGGLNVTIPYKQDVIPLCDEISPLAQAIGAVNTLYWKSAGVHNVSTDATNCSLRKTSRRTAKCENAGSSTSEPAISNEDKSVCPDDRILVGHNTDYEGFLYTAGRSGIDFAGRTVLILGTGGTSLMARKAAADCGAKKIYIASRSGCSKIIASLSDRNTYNADGKDILTANGKTNRGDIANNVCDNCNCNNKPKHSDNINADSERKCGCMIMQLSYDALPEIASEVSIIVNTTPVGTFPNNLNSVISIADFPECEAVIDVIYNPFKTRLLMDAEKAGLKTANGLPMLVAQATAAAGYFLGTPGAFEKENERIIRELEAGMRNIVLIGMPGCGKSTIGHIIAEQTGKTLVDMDEEIIKKAGKPIPQIFEEVGEAGFRDIESEVAAEIGKQRGLVIATGGGAVLREKNVDALRQNGTIIHIRRPVDSLPTDGRPLSKDIAALRSMEKIRLPLYEAAANVTFDNSIKLNRENLKTKVYDFLQNL